MARLALSRSDLLRASFLLVASGIVVGSFVLGLGCESPERDVWNLRSDLPLQKFRPVFQSVQFVARKTQSVHGGDLELARELKHADPSFRRLVVRCSPAAQRSLLRAREFEGRRIGLAHLYDRACSADSSCAYACCRAATSTLWGTGVTRRSPFRFWTDAVGLYVSAKCRGAPEPLRSAIRRLLNSSPFRSRSAKLTVDLCVEPSGIPKITYVGDGSCANPPVYDFEFLQCYVGDPQTRAVP